ncbi:MAG: hypothetical protein NC350_04520 [Corallococcus sp.]|nr:hypothetical protein [Corallococcus sp.]
MIHYLFYYGIKLEILSKIFLMTIAVVLMLITMMLLMQIKPKILFVIDLHHMQAQIVVKLAHIRVVNEKICIQGKILHCEGTIDSDVLIPKIKFSGNGIIKCFEVCKINFVTAVNTVDPIGIAVSGVFRIFMNTALQVIAECKNCRVNSAMYWTVEHSSLQGQIDVSFTTLGLISALARKKKNG